MNAIDSLGLMLIVAIAPNAVAQASGASSRTADPPLVAADSTRQFLVRAGREVLTQVFAAMSDTAAVCVSVADGTQRYRVDPADLRALSDGHRAVMHRTACPFTYASPIAYVDSTGRQLHPRPAGYVDPHYLELVLPVAWDRATAIVQVRASQGTRTTSYECRLQEAAASGSVSCRVVRHSVS